RLEFFAVELEDLRAAGERLAGEVERIFVLVLGIKSGSIGVGGAHTNSRRVRGQRGGDAEAAQGAPISSEAMRRATQAWALSAPARTSLIAAVNSSTPVLGTMMVLRRP